MRGRRVLGVELQAAKVSRELSQEARLLCACEQGAGAGACQPRSEGQSVVQPQPWAEPLVAEG